MLAECVVNVSEGRDLAVVRSIAGAGGEALLDVHTDPDHHRSVITLGGAPPDVEAAARAVVAAAVAEIDLNDHTGVHPRLGAADVVPFVALPEPSETEADGADPLTWAVHARDRLARWAAAELALPCFLYGPERSLPEIRRLAFRPLPPDVGPPAPHPTAGASAVGARDVLVAYNVSVGPVGHGPLGPGSPAALDLARRVARRVRGPAVRSLGLAAGTGAQVSCNLVALGTVGIAQLYDAVAGLVAAEGGTVLGAELVGLVPADVLYRVPRHRWAELDLAEDRTVEARLASPGLRHLPR